MPLLSIFTPTFNRAYRIKALYNSLLKQTCKNFEWIIVDDGSTDNTKDLVDEWINNE
jgi:glycosyltransferase involved in cell wall biosynthesis